MQVLEWSTALTGLSFSFLFSLLFFMKRWWSYLYIFGKNKVLSLFFFTIFIFQIWQQVLHCLQFRFASSRLGDLVGMFKN